VCKLNRHENQIWRITMLRRKILQLVLASAATSTLALMGTAVRASGGASRNDSGASRNDTGASRNDSSGASRNDSSGASRNDSSGASRNDSSGASRNDSSGASRNDSSSASRNGSGASVYCATDANGQQTCRNETSDGLSSVSDSDLAEVLRSFN